MRLIIPLRLVEMIFLSGCLWLLIHEQKFCARKDERYFIHELRQLAKEEGPCNVVLSRHIDFFFFERVGGKNETEQLSYEMNGTDLVEKVLRRVKREEELGLPLNTTDLPENVTEIDASENLKETWEDVYDLRGSMKHSSCLSVFASDVFGFSDSSIIDKKLSLVRYAVYCLLFLIFLVFEEIFYFSFRKHIPTMLGSIAVGSMRIFSAAAVGTVLFLNRSEWQTSSWGPLFPPSHPGGYLAVELFAWFLVLYHCIDTLCVNFVHSELVFKKETFGEYELANMGESTFISYDEPFDDFDPYYVA